MPGQEMQAPNQLPHHRHLLWLYDMFPELRPTEAIPMNPYLNHKIDLSKCTSCDICLQVCPVEAIVIETGMNPKATT